MLQSAGMVGLFQDVISHVRCEYVCTAEQCSTPAFIDRCVLCVVTLDVSAVQQQQYRSIAYLIIVLSFDTIR